ncbi:MAG: HNH endonuclease [Victivallales bacterium]|nr:HNH endonuclease [Victivallales bacterium]
MGEVTRKTLGEELAWQYANLARVDVALKQGAKKFTTIHHMVRMRLYKGLVNGTMQMGSFCDDEKYKIGMNICCYCNSPDHLGVDHLFPRQKLGSDLAENLVFACRSCNSSKRDRDMLSWLHAQGKFPGILLLRRYLKLAYFFCQKHDLMTRPWEEALTLDLPFDLKNLQINLAPLSRPETLSMVHSTRLAPEEQHGE